MAQRKKTFLKEWRKTNGKTLEAVAPLVGITHGQLSRIENGKSPYNQDLIEKLAILYGCDEVDLLTRDPAEPSEQSNIRFLVQKASPAQQRQISRILETIVETDSDREAG